MKYRNPIVVLLLSFITFGIYPVVWLFKTREELLDLGHSLPTAWMFFIPLVHFYWITLFCQAAEDASDGRTTSLTYFLLITFLGPIGIAILQNDFNKGALPPTGDLRITVEEIRA